MSVTLDETLVLRKYAGMYSIPCAPTHKRVVVRNAARDRRMPRMDFPMLEPSVPHHRPAFSKRPLLIGRTHGISPPTKPSPATVSFPFFHHWANDTQSQPRTFEIMLPCPRQLRDVLMQHPPFCLPSSASMLTKESPTWQQIGSCCAVSTELLCKSHAPTALSW